MQSGPKSQLAYIYMQLNLRLCSLYVLLLCLYTPYTCYYYICNGMLLAPGATRGRGGGGGVVKHVFKMAS